MENITKNEIKIKMLDRLLNIDINEIKYYKNGCDEYEGLWVKGGYRKNGRYWIYGDGKSYYYKDYYKFGDWERYLRFSGVEGRKLLFLGINEDIVFWNDLIRDTLIRYYGVVINGCELVTIYKEVVDFWYEKNFNIKNYSKICKESKYYEERIRKYDLVLRDGDMLRYGYKWNNIKHKFEEIKYMGKYIHKRVFNLIVLEFEREIDDEKDCSIRYNYGDNIDRFYEFSPCIYEGSDVLNLDGEKFKF
jgi:hypothetical protein